MRPLSILIVEDDADARNSLRNLTAMKYPAVAINCAGDGQSGLASFKEHLPDIVITDIGMPVMDGITMAAEIKSQHPDVAVIALTSHTESAYLLKSIELGMDHYLLKPLVCEKLYAVIDKHIAQISDLSHRRQMELALLKSESDLKAANELLEQRVGERTAELQASIREQEAFSYSVSHDLRAPLRHINSYSAILMEDYAGDMPRQACDYLERIRTASGRMGDLIDHLLELSRVGRAEIKMGPVDLSGLAASILGTMQETDPKRCVSVSVEPGITVLGDGRLLRQLLDNLLGNAWKYTSRKPSARIGFGRTQLAGEPTLFVRDDGAGFDMAYKENLFEAFQRLHGDEFEGYGIGLTTTRRIVHRHGGNIWAEGEVDKGATFYFTLPAYM